MSYKIRDYTYQKAKQYGVIVIPSKNKTKKLDVYNKNLVKIASIGAIGFKDYPSYLEEDKDKAEERRRLYKLRHKNDLNDGNSFWANVLLW